MALLLLLAATLFVSHRGDTTQLVVHHNDILIRNVVYDARRQCVTLDQVGGLDLIQDEYRWQWWRHADKTGLPRRDWRTGQWVLRWREEGRWIEIRAAGYQEAHTTVDLEIEDREDWPVRLRTGPRSG